MFGNSLSFRNDYFRTLNASMLSALTFAYLFLTFLHNVYDFSFFTGLTKVFCILLLFFLLMRRSISKVEVVTLLAVAGIIAWYSFADGGGLFRLSSVRFLTLAICGIVIASGEFKPFLSKILLIIVISILTYYIFLKNIDPNDVLTSSRNYISVNMICFSMVIYITDYLADKKRPVLWPALATLFLSVIAIGRAGIGVSFLLFLFILSFNLKYLYEEKLKNNKNKQTYIITGGIVFIVVLTFLTPVFMEWFQSSRFKTDGLESLRFVMWEEFFAKLTWKRAIFGFDINKLPSVVEINTINPYKDNIHNSYLDIWANLGIAAFLIFFITLLMIWRLKNISVFLVVLFLILLLRSSVDIVIYMRRFDFVFFAFLFLAFKNCDFNTSFIQTDKYKFLLEWIKKLRIKK